MSDEIDVTIEDMVVPSSSADEMEHPTKDKKKKQPAVDQVPTDDLEQDGEKRDQVPMDDQKTTDADADGGKQKRKRPRMDREEFFARYPCIHKNTREYPYRHTTSTVLETLRDGLLFVSRKELDDLEDGYMSYYKKDCEIEQQRMVIKCKTLELLQKCRNPPRHQTLPKK
ncbi:hypothetical protein L1987_53880 [Smallanthus sonchifolius]|uniref:Uncharacterized protein n=1 Tax=Smallanthus sonchifolius TaxID=185202 RepID=A0ACB9EYB5_9ASTR|nr:hypothetical protein L1987_53880 [Smallanthus sonchifolius]